jgi:hypothetical protein
MSRIHERLGISEREDGQEMLASPGHDAGLSREPAVGGER